MEFLCFTGVSYTVFVRICDSIFLDDIYKVNSLDRMDRSQRKVVFAGVVGDLIEVIVIYCRCLYIYIPGPSKVPNGWERVPLSNPLGFKHHPLEGAGIYLQYTYMFYVRLI